MRARRAGGVEAAAAGERAEGERPDENGAADRYPGLCGRW